MQNSIWIGFDPREVDAFAVCRHSIRRHARTPFPIAGLVLDDLRKAGIYRRPTVKDANGRLFDEISGFPMATEFAISRFLVPHLVREHSKWAKGNRWALFMDSDMLVTDDLQHLFRQADPSKAVMVVKHDYHPKTGMKMDGQVQTSYFRKNWSSVILFNVDHPANACLDVDLVNRWPGRDLHGFKWLSDDLIGELPVDFNYLVGHNTVDDLVDPQIELPTILDEDRRKKMRGIVGPPSIIHYTSGIPSMTGYADCEFADLWIEERNRWAR